MHNHHFLLEEILRAIHPTQIPVARKEALNALGQEVAQFLQQRFPLHHERVGELRTMGSKEKGTDVAFHYDLDLFIPFRQGFRNGPKGMKNAVFQAIKGKFENTPVTHVRPQRVGMGLVRTIGGQELSIDIVPGMEKSHGAYDDLSADEDKKYLVLYDSTAHTERTTNVHRHSRLIQDKARYYRDVVRLLKAWRNKETSIRLGSFALELLVYRAAIASDAPQTGTIDELLHFTLTHSIPFLEAKGALQEIGANYSWPDFLSKSGKTQLASLWRKLLSALETPDPEKLRSFFKVN